MGSSRSGRKPTLAIPGRRLNDGISKRIKEAVRMAMPKNIAPLAVIHFLDFRSVIERPPLRRAAL
jgi:hypothetical protein